MASTCVTLDGSPTTPIEVTMELHHTLANSNGLHLANSNCLIHCSKSSNPPPSSLLMSLYKINPLPLSPPQFLTFNTHHSSNSSTGFIRTSQFVLTVVQVVFISSADDISYKNGNTICVAKCGAVRNTHHCCQV